MATGSHRFLCSGKGISMYAVDGFNTTKKIRAMCSMSAVKFVHRQKKCVSGAKNRLAWMVDSVVIMWLVFVASRDRQRFYTHTGKAFQRARISLRAGHRVIASAGQIGSEVMKDENKHDL